LLIKTIFFGEYWGFSLYSSLSYVYTGSAEGFRAPVTVFTTFSEDRIAGIFISKHAETIDTSHVAEGHGGTWRKQPHR
jgi:hypothetical protein